MSPEDIRFTKEAFGLSSRDLAQSLAVADVTLERWERGSHRPSGLSLVVLQTFHHVALDLHRRGDAAAIRAVRSLILMGVGHMVYIALHSDQKVAPS